MNNIYELGSKLCELLSTLKKNREYVPLEILQTQYRVPYETLKKQIGDTATAFVKEITLSKLMINPDVSLEEQISVIQQTITTSGILKESGTWSLRRCSPSRMSMLWFSDSYLSKKRK